MSTAVTPELVNPAPLPFRSLGLDLTIRQKSFVDNLIQVKVGWKAAELAGYSGDNATLRAMASETLAKPNVRAYYEERLAELQISSTEVLAEIGEIARHDIVADPKGPIRAVDKLKALELAGKYHKLFDQPAESQVNSGAIATEVVAMLCAIADRARAAAMDQVGQVGQPALPPASMDRMDQSQVVEVTATTLTSEQVDQVAADNVDHHRR